MGCLPNNYKALTHNTSQPAGYHYATDRTEHPGLGTALPSGWLCS